MRTAPDTPENGQTVRTTTVRTVLPADPLTPDKNFPEFWPYLEALPVPFDKQHLLYIYRILAERGPMLPLEKTSGYIKMPGGREVAVNDQQELEFAIMEKYGGGTYRLMLKKGSGQGQRMVQERMVIDGPAKNTQPGILENLPDSPAVQSAPVTADVATTAMNLVANHEGKAIEIGMHALQGAADVVQRLSQPNSPAPSQGDELTRQFIQVMMARAMADPFEQMVKFAGLMQSFGGNGGALSPALQKILDTFIERGLNPAPSGPVSSTGAELVRALPQVIGVAAEAAKEWRLGSEAQLQTAQLMATANRALPPAAGTVQPSGTPGTPGRPITQATQITPPPPEAQAMPGGAPTLAFVELKIVEILREPISADECADKVLTFLDVIDPTLVDRLASLGEAQLIQMFQTRPVLAQYHDLARLQEFIKAFLKYSNESDGPPAPSGTAKPN